MMTRVAAVERFGGPELLKLRTLPVPEIDPAKVLIAVHKAWRWQPSTQLDL